MGVEVNNAHRIVSSNWNSIRTDGNLDTENDQANMAHVESSSLKLCLKSKILSRRRQRGLNDIHVDFTPRQSYPMTAEEKEKDEKRRQSNRISARKSRIKQRKQWERDEKILLKLESERDKLRNKISEYEAEKSAIMTAFENSIPASRIKEYLAEKVDYNLFNKYPENINQRFGDILEEIEASDGTGETGGFAPRVLCTGETGGFAPRVLCTGETGGFAPRVLCTGETGGFAPRVLCTGETGGFAPRVLCTGETGGFAPRVLEESEMPVLEDLQLSNDCFVQSEFLTKFDTEENTTDNFDMNVVNVLDTVNHSFIFNSVDDNI